MNIDKHNRREKMMKLRSELLAVEEDRLRGCAGYSVSEVASMMQNVINETIGNQESNYSVDLGQDYKWLLK